MIPARHCHSDALVCKWVARCRTHVDRRYFSLRVIRLDCSSTLYNSGKKVSRPSKSHRQNLAIAARKYPYPVGVLPTVYKRMKEAIGSRGEKFS